jgi:hypothetical protein
MMNKLFFSGAIFFISLIVFGSTHLMNNTVNEQFDFTQQQIIDTKEYPVIKTQKIAFEKEIPETQVQADKKSVSETVSLEDQSLSELTGRLLDAISNNDDHESIIKLARIRKQKMADAIRNNPEMAIQWAIDSDTRERLPEDIKRYIERQIDNTASNSMFAAGGNQPHQENLRTLMVKGQTFHAFVYGERLEQAVFDHEPVQGIALGNLMAVADDTIQSEQTVDIQEPEEVQITHTFYVNPGEISFERRKDFDLVKLIDSVPADSKPGSPLLPTRLVSIEIPPGATVLGVSAQGEDSIFKAGIEIYPNQPQTPTNQEEPADFVQPDPNVYDSSHKIPERIAISDGTRHVRGKTYVALRLNPVRYIPKNQELYLTQSIKVTIDCLTPAIPPASTDNENDQMLHAPLGLYDSPTQATDQRDDDMSTHADVQTSSIEISTHIQYDYLIITGSDLVDTFQLLADHRQNFNAYSTKILTIDEINTQYDGTRPDGNTDLQTKIRNAIADYVQNNGTTYVVLGGDNTIVPDRDTYVSVGSYEESHMPTDLYYAGLDGTWDEWDMDGTYGEAYVDSQWDQNEGDLSADVLLGRIPIQTPDQAAAYINKVIAYETEPSNEILKKMLIAGEKLWNRYADNSRPDEVLTDGHIQFRDSNHQSVSDAEIWGRRMYRDTVENYFQDNQISYLFDTLTSWDTDTAGSYASSRDNMIIKFNEGWNFMTYNTHGNTNIWATESKYFKDSHAIQLNNLTAFVYTIACITGAFDRERSLSEGFIRNPNGGAIAYMGCSRYGWGSPGSNHGGTSLNYQRKFYEKVFKDEITNVGEAFNAHKAAYSPSSSYNGSYRWVQFGMNLQGDPAVEIKGVRVNQGPEANDQTVVVNMNTATSIHLDATNPDGEYLEFILIAGPEHGRLSDVILSECIYTPDNDYIGSDSFTYQVSDGELTSRIATVAITIQTEDNIPPTPPENLEGEALEESLVHLQWEPSTDNNTVSGYYIYRNNDMLSRSSETFFEDHNVHPDTIYIYAVQAYDAVGNMSDKSNIVQIQTLPEQFPPDGQIPDQWTKTGNAGWHVCETKSSSGTLSLQADAINDMQTAGIQFTANFSGGVIQFDLFVSSEKRFDELTFFIDGDAMNSWSGAQDNWSTVSYQIDPGVHTIGWIYAKDYSESSGEDTAWIDNVSLPENTPPYAVLTMDIVGQGRTTPQAGTHYQLINQSFSIRAFPETGHVFDHWTASPEATIAHPEAQTTTVMMSDDSVVTAVFKKENHPPSFDSDFYSLEPIAEDSDFSLDISGYANDPDENDRLTYEIISGPQWLRSDTDNIIYGTPTNDNVGVNVFVIRVKDSMGAIDDARFEIHVENVNDAPGFTFQTITGGPALKDQAYQFSVAPFAVDPDVDDILTFSKEQGPEWLILSENGSIEGTPTEIGTQTFAIKVMDQAGAFGTAMLIISVKDDDSNQFAPGITVAYYDFHSKLASLPNFDGSPDLVRIESDVNYYKSRNVWPDLEPAYKDTYASIHNGYIFIENSGAYTFYLKSDDGSRLWINGVLVIDNDGLHGMREKSGTVSLESGYHHFRIHFFENYGHTGLILSYKSEDIQKKVVPADILFHTTQNMQPVITSKTFKIFDQQGQDAIIGRMTASDPNLMDQLTFSILSPDDHAFGIVPDTGEIFISNPDAVQQMSGSNVQLNIKVTDNGALELSDTASAWIIIDTLEDMKPGLRAEFFDYNEKLSRLPDLSNQRPDMVRTDDQLNYRSTRQAWEGLSDNFKDTFASRHTGNIYISTSGTYTFYLKSDDGSKLWINHKLLIDNDGLHGMREKKSTLSLEEGFHTVRIEFFENKGGAGLIFSYKSEAFNKCVVPASVLFQSTRNMPPSLFAQTGIVVAGQEIGTIVAKMEAFDPNFGDTITYAITDGNLNSAFDMNPSTGEVSILNPQAIDKEVHPSFHLQITATDNGVPQESDTECLTITVYNRNDYLPGVRTEFFNETRNIRKLPDLSDRSPNIIRTDAWINYQKSSQAWSGLPSEYKSNFVSRHTGYLYLESPGLYTLYLNSDDGSKLWVNGELVINNSGLHAMRERAAMLELGAGYHHIRLEYFERTGWAGLVLSYSSDFIEKQVIPESIFYHTVVQDIYVPSKQSTQVIANIGITDGEEEWLETDYDDEDSWFVEDYTLADDN